MMMLDGRIKSVRIFALETQKKPPEKNQDLNKGKQAADPSSKNHHTKSGVVQCGSALIEVYKLQQLLDALKRRDSRNLFLEPVNAEEVEDYYDVIEEPMDFGTISTKLNGGSYKSLQEFEDDVTLVWSNAMRFNSSNTLYYRQARAIRDLATNLLDSLKTDPEHFVAQAERKGKRRLENSAFDRRDSYRPPNTMLNENESIVSTVYRGSQQLVRNEMNSTGYEESLLKFVKGLGPTANMVARRKLQELAEARNVERVSTSSDSINLPGRLRNGLAHSNFPATWEAQYNIRGKSLQAAPVEYTGTSHGMSALLGGSSSKWWTYNDLRERSIQPVPDQNMWNSYSTSPFGSSFISNSGWFPNHYTRTGLRAGTPDFLKQKSPQGTNTVPFDLKVWTDRFS